MAHPLAILLDLEARLRAFERLEEVYYFLVNDLKPLCNFRQAVLFDENFSVVALSGVSNVDKDTPYVQWLGDVASAQIKLISEPKLIKIPASEEWLPNYIYGFPVQQKEQSQQGFLLLGAEEELEPKQINLLQHLLEAAAYTLKVMRRKKWSALRHKIPKKAKAILVLAGLAVMFLPIRLSVLAPAEIIALDPVTVRAPMKGVIHEVSVKPNQTVDIGETLFKLDQTDLQNDLLVAQKTLQSLVAQYRQATRLALQAPSSKTRLTVLSGQIKEQQARVQHVQNLIERSIVLSPRKATVVIDNVEDWKGQPVQVGERVLVLADEHKVEIEAWLSINDAIPLENGSPIELFLNSSPTSAIKAHLKYLSFSSQVRPDGIVAHRVLANLEPDQDMPRLGAAGTARLHGERVTLFYWVMRKPVSIIRQFFGI